MDEFQTELIEHLKTSGFNAKDYFGEFDDRANVQVLKTFLPGVMVDYVESQFKSNYEEKAEFSLYIVYAGYSKQEEKRTAADMTLLRYIRSIRRAVVERGFGNSSPVEMTRARKLLDAARNGMYLVVYLATITATVYDEEPINLEVIS